MNNAATLLIFGGSRDPDDLAAYSTLTGERYEQTPTWDDEGALSSVSRHRVPVLTPAQIAQLPARHVVIIRRGMAPAVGTVQMAWKRRQVRAAYRAIAFDRFVERWADRCDQWCEYLGDWAQTTTIGNITVAQRIGLTVHHRAQGGEAVTDSEGTNP